MSNSNDTQDKLPLILDRWVMLMTLVVPIIRIFMIDLNQKSTIKKIKLVEKLAKKKRCTHLSMNLLLTNFIRFHGIKGLIGPHTYEPNSRFGFRSSDLEIYPYMYDENLPKKISKNQS